MGLITETGHMIHDKRLLKVNIHGMEFVLIADFPARSPVTLVGHAPYSVWKRAMVEAFGPHEGPLIVGHDVSPAEDPWREDLDFHLAPINHGVAFDGVHLQVNKVPGQVIVFASGEGEKIRKVLHLMRRGEVDPSEERKFDLFWQNQVPGHPKRLSRKHSRASVRSARRRKPAIGVKRPSPR